MFRWVHHQVKPLDPDIGVEETDEETFRRQESFMTRPRDQFARSSPR